jgi:hypothetical protein
MPQPYEFDLFISYKSEDHHSAVRLKDALLRRGVWVWLDNDEIRPGDKFVRALENGIRTSKAVALLVTPESAKSEWVEDEYNLALRLSNQRNLQLIPILLGGAGAPGFLGNRQHIDLRSISSFNENIDRFVRDDVDFQEDPQEEFEIVVDRLVWPGITGKHIVCYNVNPPYGAAWRRLFSVAQVMRLDFQIQDLLRNREYLAHVMRNSRKRIIVFLDIFEGRPSRKGDIRYTPLEYIEFIFSLRDETRGLPNEIIFVLYHQSDAWKLQGDVAMIAPEVRSRIQHYFHLEQNTPNDSDFHRQFRGVYYKVQRELMLREQES